ncbi:MAG: HDOD domain-containing protein [Rhodoferax sp.]
MTPFLTQALPDLAAWVRHFQRATIPVLRSSAARLEELRALDEEDKVDAGMLGGLIESDPFFSVKVMAFVAGKRRHNDDTETETVTSALVYIGVSPFLRAFGVQPTVEDHLADHPEALDGVQRLLLRAERAAHFATAFAIHRRDHDVAVIRQAAFLHDFAELLMWVHAPALCMDIHHKQRENPTLRSVPLQRFVYHIELQELRQALMKLWRLPQLLVRISDEKHAEHPMVRNVVLAVRLARHTQGGWDNAALPDDIHEIAELLNVSERAARGFVYKVDQGRSAPDHPADGVH